MGLLTGWARRRRIALLLDGIPRDARILEVGCGERWVGDYFAATGHTGYVGLDLKPPADVVGSILEWRALGLAPGSFDVVVAFEVVEHVPCFQACHDLLKPGGLLLLTTPVPHWDWACRLLEAAGVSQRRTSPHAHLVYVEDIPLFERVASGRFLLLGQWAKLRRPAARAG